MDFPNSKGSYNELQVAKEVGMPYENASGFSEETLAYLDRGKTEGDRAYQCSSYW